MNAFLSNIFSRNLGIEAGLAIWDIHYDSMQYSLI